VRVGILTGGGDVPGLNPCIKAVVDDLIDAGHEVVGIRRGWAGLLFYNPDDAENQREWIRPLNKLDVRTIDRTGGTFLHTSRTNPANVKNRRAPSFLVGGKAESEPDVCQDHTSHCLRVIDHLKLDSLIVIGGDDTLSFALQLHKQGTPIVAIPKTMDNDVYGTDYCIGFSTAITRSVDFITSLRTPAGSHERIAVVELFGRNSGETSLISAYLANVDRAIISEVPFSVQKLANMLLEDKRANPSNYAIMTISEGARFEEGEIVQEGEADDFGNPKLGGIGETTGNKIADLTGEKVINQRLAYLMRGGAPDSLDRMVALSFGHLAAQLLMKHNTGHMVAIHSGNYSTTRLSDVGIAQKRVDVDELYDSENYRPVVRHVMGKPMFLY
jgi:6-phosphofructokinase